MFLNYKETHNFLFFSYIAKLPLKKKKKQLKTNVFQIMTFVRNSFLFHVELKNSLAQKKRGLLKGNELSSSYQ